VRPGAWDRSDAPQRPTVDEVDFHALYRKTRYLVETADRWTLSVTRYRPIAQPYPQPILGEPLLLVHGFSQNRHAWTSGEFVKNLLYFGADIHILELRGHGKSSIEFQQERARKLGRPLPADLDYGWDLDSYFLYDLPATVAAVKRVTGRDKIFYCGHSMGGMLGYGYAGIHDDLEGLITIGSAADLGRGFWILKAISHTAPLIGAGIDAAFGAVNVERSVERGVARLTHRAKAFFGRADGPEPNGPDPANFRYVPVNVWLQWLERLLAKAETHPLWDEFARRVNWLSNPQRVSAADIRWLLREGGEREPRKVIEQFAKWIRRGELRCYRTGYDFKRGFSKIRMPMAIIFGDMDPLASVESTRGVYRAAQSEYLLWRPVKGNSHIELTMGHDIRQICYDIKNLIEYARTHRERTPSLPRQQKRRAEKL
jgi:pimeloyl-ACP methyl ester carboxylesterase